jgi:restriction system protein
MCFPEFLDFQQRKRDSSTDITESTEVSLSSDKATPEEVINAAYKELRDALAQEILDRIKAMPPIFFENLNRTTDAQIGLW